MEFLWSVHSIRVKFCCIKLHIRLSILLPMVDYMGQMVNRGHEKGGFCLKGKITVIVFMDRI